MNRKRSFCAIIFLTVLLLASCDPVPDKTEIDYQPMQTDGRNITMETGHPRYLSVSFSVMKGAVSYELRVFTDDGSFDRTFPVDLKKNSKDGRITVIVTGVSDGQEYRASLTVKDREGSVVTYTPAESWIKEIAPEKPNMIITAVKTKPEEGTLLPTIQLQFPNTQSCRVVFEKDGKIIYESIEHGNGKGGTAMKNVTPKSVSEDGTKSDLYITPDTAIRAYTGIEKNGSIEWHEETASIMYIPEDELMFSSSLFMYYDASKNSFKCSGKATKDEDGNPVEVELWKFDPSTRKKDLVGKSIGAGAFLDDGGNPFVLTHSFETGCYYAKTDSVASRPQFPVANFLDFSVRADQQNIYLSWASPEDEDMIYDGVTEWQRGNDGRTEAVISGLESRKSDIAGTITAYLPAAKTKSQKYTASTTSFAGKYQWTDRSGHDGQNAVQYTVNVVEAPEGSSFKYYVYTAQEDPKWSGSYHRISPVFDSSLEDVPKDWIPYMAPEGTEASLPQMAYIWSSRKWNTSPAEPSKWKPGSTEVRGDTVVTMTESVAEVMGMVQQVRTRTEVRFYVDEDGNPKMDFLNKALGDLGAMVNGMFLNVNWNNVNGKLDPSSDAPWTFDLVRIDDADQITEGGSN